MYTNLLLELTFYYEKHITTKIQYLTFQFLCSFKIFTFEIYNHCKFELECCAKKVRIASDYR